MAEENQVQQAPAQQAAPAASTKSPSKLWYLVAFILGIIGGIIAYIVVRKDDPKMARNALILGIVMTVISVIIVVAFPALVLLSL